MTGRNASIQDEQTGIYSRFERKPSLRINCPNFYCSAVSESCFQSRRLCIYESESVFHSEVAIDAAVNPRFRFANWVQTETTTDKYGFLPALSPAPVSVSASPCGSTKSWPTALWPSSHHRICEARIAKKEKKIIEIRGATTRIGTDLKSLI